MIHNCHWPVCKYRRAKFDYTVCRLLIIFIVSILYQYIEDIQIFGMNMPFISSSEAKNAYFMSGEATNEIYIFSLHEMK